MTDATKANTAAAVDPWSSRRAADSEETTPGTAPIRTNETVATACKLSAALCTFGHRSRALSTAGSSCTSNCSGGSITRSSGSLSRWTRMFGSMAEVASESQLANSSSAGVSSSPFTRCGVARSSNWLACTQSLPSRRTYVSSVPIRSRPARSRSSVNGPRGSPSDLRTYQTSSLIANPIAFRLCRILTVSSFRSVLRIYEAFGPRCSSNMTIGWHHAKAVAMMRATEPVVPSRKRIMYEWVRLTRSPSAGLIRRASGDPPW